MRFSHRSRTKCEAKQRTYCQHEISSPILRFLKALLSKKKEENFIFWHLFQLHTWKLETILQIMVPILSTNTWICEARELSTWLPSSVLKWLNISHTWFEMLSSEPTQQEACEHFESHHRIEYILLFLSATG